MLAVYRGRVAICAGGGRERELLSVPGVERGNCYLWQRCGEGELLSVMCLHRFRHPK